MDETAPKPETPSTIELVEGAVRGHAELRATALALVQMARREIRLFAPILDPIIFNTESMANAIASFATQHPRNRLRLLVENVAQLQRDGSRLLGTMRRLADAAEIRVVDEHEQGARDFCLIADRAAQLLQEDIGRNDGVASRAAREIAARIERFDAAWDKSQPIALNTLGL